MHIKLTFCNIFYLCLQLIEPAYANTSHKMECIDLSSFKDDYTSEALFTRDILAYNIVIKRYWDKKIILSHMFPWPIKISCKKHTLNCFACLFTFIFFCSSLPWPLNIHGSKIYFYFNIFLSQYCASKCLVWIRPKGK